MDVHSSSSNSILNAYLYSTDNPTDHWIQGSGRILKSKTPPRVIEGTALIPKTKEKTDEVVIGRLEKEMNRLTDPVLLADAREDQRGLKEGTRSFA